MFGYVYAIEQSTEMFIFYYRELYEYYLLCEI